MVSVGIATGVLAAFGFYLHDRSPLVAVQLSLLPLLLVAGAGAYVQLFSPRLRQSIGSAILSFVTAIVVYLLLQTAQLWLLSYAPAVREALLLQLLERAATGLFLEFVVAYWSGYLLLVSIEGYFS
jgi:hypothetical protein